MWQRTTLMSMVYTATRDYAEIDVMETVWMSVVYAVSRNHVEMHDACSSSL